MTRLLPQTAPPARTVADTQPASFFMLENLLLARSRSMFPTNGAGPDEDVNVYLADLLTRHLGMGPSHDPNLAGWPLLSPPAKNATRWSRSEYYRANADHRLLYLGLFQRGDGVRRRHPAWGCTADETRAADLATGRICYAAAANHLRARTASEQALSAVWRKLALHFNDYVHVLGALATRQLGLGARLARDDLKRLLPDDQTADARAVAQLLQAPAPPEAMDVLLDLWLDLQKNPDPVAQVRLRDMANRLGVRLATDSAVAESDNLVE